MEKAIIEVYYKKKFRFYQDIFTYIYIKIFSFVRNVPKEKCLRRPISV